LTFHFITCGPASQLAQDLSAGLWTYVRDERPYGGERPPAATFFYSPDRKSERPRAHLTDFTGVLHTDGYSGFKGLYQGNRIVEAACGVHVRRKFLMCTPLMAPRSARSTMSKQRSTARERRRPPVMTGTILVLTILLALLASGRAAWSLAPSGTVSRLLTPRLVQQRLLHSIRALPRQDCSWTIDHCLT
jgi:hypothetical protein